MMTSASRTTSASLLRRALPARALHVALVIANSTGPHGGGFGTRSSRRRRRPRPRRGRDTQCDRRLLFIATYGSRPPRRRRSACPHNNHTTEGKLMKTEFQLARELTVND